VEEQLEEGFGEEQQLRLLEQKAGRRRNLFVDEDEEFGQREEEGGSREDHFDFKGLTNIRGLNDSRHDDFEGFEDYF